MAKDNAGRGGLGWLLLGVLALASTLLGAIVFGALGHELLVGWFPQVARWLAIGIGVTFALLVPLLLDLWVSARYRKLDPNARNTSLQTLPFWNLIWVVLALGLLPVVSRRALESAGGAFWPVPQLTDNPLARAVGRVARLIPRSEPALASASAPDAQGVSVPGHTPQTSSPNAADPAVASAGIAGAGIAGAGLAGSAGAVAPVANGASSPLPAVVEPSAAVATEAQLFEGDQTPEVLFTARADSVVLIVTRSPVPDMGPLAGLLEQFGVEVQVGSGSGFFVGKDLLVTNHHVIEGAESASVTLRGGQHYEAVSVLADDHVHDLALLSVEGLLGAPIPLLPVERQVAIGAAALAIGSPLGLEFSLTDGIVSAKRKLQGTDFLQMQTPIAPGSSGGPLINRRGELIGVNTATKSASLNLAVSVTHVRDLLALPRTAKPLQRFVAGVRVTEVATIGVESSSIDRLSYQEGAQWLASTAERCVRSVPEGASVTYRSSMSGADPDIESNLDAESTRCLREKGAMLRKLVGLFLATAYGAEVRAGKEVGLELTLEGLPRRPEAATKDEQRPLKLSFLVKK